MRQSFAWGAFAFGMVVAVPAVADVLQTDGLKAIFELAPAVTGLTQPTSFDWLPDGRLVITDKAGGVYLADGKGGAGTLIGTLAVDTESEKGLLHVLLHPQFATNRLLFFYYSATDANGGTDLDRHRVVTIPLTDKDTLDVAKETVLLRNLRGPANHDGGALAIGPDGKLYIGVGDTGCNSGARPDPAVAPRNYSGTCLTHANGKILRINLDGTIPGDNPLVGQTRVSACAQCPIAPSLAGLGIPRTEIWAWGFRNPWRFSFDAKTGNLWVGDVGEVTYEELDIIPPNGGGKHYGWPWREGFVGSPRSTCQIITPNVGDCVDPAYSCLHNPDSTLPPPLADGGTEDGSCNAIVGGVIADSCAIPPPYRGRYFFADAANSWVATLTPTADRNAIVRGSREMLATANGSPSHVAVGPDGAVYYAVIGGTGTGAVQRLSPKVPSTCAVAKDAGAKADAGVPRRDAGAPVDASVDASEPSNGGASSGGSGNTGGRTSAGGSATAGAAARPDAGKSGSSGDDSGCGCRVASGPGSSLGALATALAALTLFGRRRRGDRGVRP